MSEQVMEVDSQLAKQALQTNSFVEHFDKALERILNEMGIERRSKLTKREYRYMEQFLKGNTTFKKFNKLIEKFGEKEICRNCFNSSWNEFYEYKKILQSIEVDRIDVEKNGKYQPLTEEEGKAIQDPRTGNHIPALMTHFEKNLGDLAGFVSLSNRGYVAELFKQGYIRKITPESAKRLVFEATHEVISDIESHSVAHGLNQERMIIEANMIQNVHGDSKTTKQAISIITNAGKKNSWTYAKTNELGTEVRKECQKYDNEFGKLIAYAKTEEIPLEKKEGKASRLLFNMMKAMNLNVDNCVASITKMNSKKRL